MTLFSPLDTRVYVLLASSTFVVFLTIWTLLSWTVPAADVFLPSPVTTIIALEEMLTEHSFLTDIGASVYRVTVGFLLAVLVALPLGGLAGTIPAVDALVQPFNDFVRYMPVASFIPLTILWLGIDDSQKFAIIFLGTVFQLIPLIADTASRVPKHLVDLGYTLGLSPWAVLRTVVVPWSAPILYDHCRVALGWAWTYLIVAEIVASTSGIGHVIIQSQRFIRTDEVLAGVLVIGAIGLCFDLLFKLPRRRLFPWT